MEISKQGNSDCSNADHGFLRIFLFMTRDDKFFNSLLAAPFASVSMRRQERSSLSPASLRREPPPLAPPARLLTIDLPTIFSTFLTMMPGRAIGHALRDRRLPDGAALKNAVQELHHPWRYRATRQLDMDFDQSSSPSPYRSNCAVPTGEDRRHWASPAGNFEFRFYVIYILHITALGKWIAAPHKPHRDPVGICPSTR